MTTLKQHLIQERVLRERIHQYIDNSKKTAIAKRTQGFYEIRNEELRDLWKQYCELDLQIMQRICEECPEEEANIGYIKENYYSIMQTKYVDYMGEISEGLRSYKVETGSNAAINESSPNIVVQQDAALPRISLPKFNGDYDMWRPFADLFVSLVHNNARLSPVQKLHHLKSCLVGEAERVLRHTPITDADYQPAWNKLKKRFENTRILVNHQLKQLVNQPKLIAETNKGIKTLIDTTEECLQQLQSLEVDTSAWDALLIYILVQKLPFYTLKLWEEEQGASEELPTWKKFQSFLNTRLKVLESIADVLGHRSTSSKPKLQQKERTSVLHTMKEGRCPACQGKHYLRKCAKYSGMSPEARRKVITSTGRCLNCLSQQHAHSECKSRYNCFRCNQRHHTSLHEDSSRKQSTTRHIKENGEPTGSKPKQLETIQEDNNCSAAEQEITQAFVARQRLRALLSTAFVVARGGKGQARTLRCLIDPGSESSFITEEAYKTLQTSCTSSSMVITCIGNISVANGCKETTLQLQSTRSNGPTVEEKFLIIKEITDALPRQRIAKGTFQHVRGLQMADPTYWKPGKIDALLGAIVYAQIIQHGVILGSKTAPAAVNTIFGWILVGPTNHQGNKEAVSLMATTDTNLSNRLKQFFEIEEYPSHPVFKEEEERCQTIFQTTHTRMENGQYQVKLPFVDDESPKLGKSRPQALTRFLTLQKQFGRKPDLAKEYTHCLNEYIQLGHMEMAAPIVDNTPHYYIPHHAVFKDSTTTKLRVVFDASCKTSTGKSLNEYLLKGPILQPKLFATLLKWRKYKIAMIADVEKMYRMILIHPEHRPYQRIIWKYPETGEEQDYQLNTVTFGTSSAPYLAIRTLQQLAVDERDNWPLASKAAFKDFYVDDLLTGAEDVTSAKLLQNELILMLKSGGFKLRKWASNNIEVLNHLSPEYCASSDSLSIGEEETLKTLGIQWIPKQDYFTFRVSPKIRQGISTKRSILSKIATLYDPLGWLAPIIIVAKILMQAMWITGCSWDDPASPTINNQWEKFKEDLEHLNRVRIPRWIQYTSKAYTQLHGFCDASTKAYAAVIYLLTIQEDGSISAMLLTAKTRVAPTKPTTTPRLELNGAVILARLIKTTVKDMELENVPIFAWTDSTIVLQWIREHPSRWKTYVANRVVEIQDSVKFETWQHVPTTENPADLASRGITMKELLSKDIWWHGPDWLKKSEDKWPRREKSIESTDLEAKKDITASFATTVQDDFLLRYSSFDKLKRITALILRFKGNCKGPTDKQIGFISSSELRSAETTVLRLMQKTSFPDDHYNLLHNKPLAHKSTLLQLNPFIDVQGLIRVKGRLSKASIAYDSKHPIILPKTHHLTSLIIDKIHRETLHGGTSLVLATSRSKYWILDARRAIASRIYKCITCARFRKETCQQLMGDLPEARVNISKPFCKVGIDYAGPIQVKASPLRKAQLLKAYLCIFVCMATRAIHIELVSALTTDAFIAALKRFIARRGLCTDIYSDCGSNFIGARSTIDKDIKNAISNATQEAAKYSANQSISWHFNPPGAPHFGGTWEAGVRSVKHHLRRSIGNMTCTFEEYATVLTQIEAMLNSRPLCYVTTDPSNPEVLTPGHFLIGQPLNALPEPDYAVEAPLTQRWKQLQQRIHHFWKRWSKEYLHQLQTRPKWNRERRNLQVGDVVLVTNENMPPAKWPLGIVEEVYPGADGFVRVAQVKTQTTLLRRPVAKLARLPLETP